MIRTIRRIYLVFDGIIEHTLAIMLVVMVVNVAFNVFTRYVFYLPIIWAEEFARYIMIWFAYLGMGLALRDHDHVSLVVVKELASPSIRKVIDFIINMFILSFLVLLTYLSLKYMDRLKGQTSPAMGISMQVPYFSVCAGAFLMVAQQIKRTIIELKDGNS